MSLFSCECTVTSAILWTLGLAFLYQYHKVLPFMYHARIYLSFLHRIFFESKITSLNDEIIHSDRVLLSDMDFNLHMNNAMYNNILDFCRIRWMVRVSDSPRQLLKQVRFANGGVSMFFIKELRFFQTFQVRTRVISYDRKWIYIGHIFESHNRKKLFALGVARVVVKEKSGKTIPPVEFFERNNITIPPKFEDVQGTASEPLTSLLEHLQRASGHAPVPPTPVADDAKKEK